MTESDAQAWISERFGADAANRMGGFLRLVVAENDRQNLIAPSTIAQIWARHAADSAQLVPLGRDGLWIDIGTGGGFPGIVVALLRAAPVLLVEPRRKRADFLQHCVETLNLRHVHVAGAKIESIEDAADIISARAVASVENLLRIAAGCAKKSTRWLLPRGRSVEADLAALKQSWRGLFHVEQSLTDPESSILVLDEVSRR